MKRILPILCFMLLLSSSGFSQAGNTRVPEPGKTVKFYPNPASSNITFDLQGSYKSGLTIAIYSFLGKKMTELRNVNEKTNVALTNYNRGVYIFYVTDASGKVMENGKFQVSN